MNSYLGNSRPSSGASRTNQTSKRKKKTGEGGEAYIIEQGISIGEFPKSSEEEEEDRGILGKGGRDGKGGGKEKERGRRENAR